MYIINRIRAYVYEDDDLITKMAKNIKPLKTDNLEEKRKYIVEHLRKKGGMPNAIVKVYFSYYEIK